MERHLEMTSSLKIIVNGDDDDFGVRVTELAIQENHITEPLVSSDISLYFQKLLLLSPPLHTFYLYISEMKFISVYFIFLLCLKL